MIHWLLSLLLSVIAGFLTASFLFSFSPVKHLFIHLGKTRFVSPLLVFVGILLIPSLAVMLTFKDGILEEHLLSLWITTLFSINLFVFIGIGISDGRRFWRELGKSNNGSYLSADVFDFCYTQADFQFINDQVKKYCSKREYDAGKVLSKIYSAYRDANRFDYRKLILVTHSALAVLPKKDKFWQAYRQWGIDPGNYAELKSFSQQKYVSRKSEFFVTNRVERRKKTGWKPRIL